MRRDPFANASPFRTAAFTISPTRTHPQENHQPGQVSGDDAKISNDAGMVKYSDLIAAMLASGHPNIAVDKGVPTVTTTTTAM